MSAEIFSSGVTVTEKVPAPLRKSHSYSQIVKSSALVGGSSLVNIAIGIVRTKAMAVLLGPSGVGLVGLYSSIVDLSSTVAGMGVNGSGVRQIAAAVGSGDTERIARSVAVLRKTSIALGVLGALLLIAFSKQVSVLSFGTDQHAAPVSLVSLAVLFRLISAGQGALIQGMQRIADIAKMGVLGAVIAAPFTIVLIYFLRERGIVPSLVGGAAISIFISWWYSRKIHIQTPSITISEVGQEAADLLKLGFAFMASVLMTMGAAYAIRVIVLRKFGLEATGFYQSAWTLGGLYVGFILQAMGTDFYPRLTARANDHTACNRMVNEQTQVGLLLASPGVLATLTFAPIVIALFYNTKFAAAVPILRWICLGTILQVITWPMGYIALAKAKQNIFLLSDLSWTCVYIALTWICLKYFGLNGIGMAYFGSYIFHLLLTYPIARYLSSFRWSNENKRTGLLVLSSIALVFCGFYLLPFVWAVCVGTLATALITAHSFRTLLRLLSFDQLPRSLRRVFTDLGFLPSRCPATD
jgi:PST family polysaccharide transporter